jgi:predicted nucleic acid-binding protein
LSFVLDASVILAWALEDEASRYADAVQDAMTAGEMAFAPCHWPVEVVNGLLMAERRKRIDPAALDWFLETLDSVPVQTEEASLATARAPVARLAREHGMTAYDAAYLELADRRAVPLATLDHALVAAARRSRIGLWSPPP